MGLSVARICSQLALILLGHVRQDGLRKVAAAGVMVFAGKKCLFPVIDGDWW